MHHGLTLFAERPKDGRRGSECLRLNSETCWPTIGQRAPSKLRIIEYLFSDISVDPAVCKVPWRAVQAVRNASVINTRIVIQCYFIPERTYRHKDQKQIAVWYVSFFQPGIYVLCTWRLPNIQSNISSRLGCFNLNPPTIALPKTSCARLGEPKSARIE